MKLVMIDNYDSFTFNLVQLFFEFDIDVRVFRHDRTSVAQIARMRPDWICISPGPKTPAQSGVSKAVVKELGSSIPILGVCLGMQVINEVFHGRTVKAPVPVHGKCSLVRHQSRGLFAGLPSPFRAARYHSLQVKIRSKQLVATAESDDAVVMGLRHRSLPIHGVQFHPESFMSEFGLEIIANFLRLAERFDTGSIPHGAGKDRFPRWNGNGASPSACPPRASIAATGR